MGPEAHGGRGAWPAYMGQWRVGQILVGGGWGFGWGTLAGRSEQEVGGA